MPQQSTIGRKIGQKSAGPGVRGSETRQMAAHAPASQKNLTGPGFWMMVMAATLKDLLDLLLNFTVILSLLVIFFGLIISFTIALYFFMSGVSFTTLKLAVFVASSIIEMMPFVSFLPMTTITLLAVRKMEHSDFAKKATTLIHAP